MAIWIFQILIDFFVVALVLMVLQQKKRIERLERALDAADAQNSAASISAEKAEIISTAVNTPLGENTSTLSEKNIIGAKKAFVAGAGPSADAYERADEMISKGVDMKEIGQKTGLSLSELRLLGKVSTRNH